MKTTPLNSTLLIAHKPCGLPRDSLLCTVVYTAMNYNQWGCLNMNPVGCYKSMILFFSRKYTQLCGRLHGRVNAINGVRDMAIKSITYTAKNIIKGTTLNQLVGGSNPPRPKGFTSDRHSTLYRFLYRLENHSNKINDRDGIEGRASLRRLWRVQPCLCQKYPPLRVAGYKSMPHLSDLDHPCSKICVAVVEWLTR